MSTPTRNSIWRRMPVEQMEDEEERNAGGRLAKSLGLWQLTAIGVGGIIGVGIFSLAGLASAAAALSYAEFAGMIPRAGSAYTYGYVALGEIVGWFIGWDLLLSTSPSSPWWRSASPATSRRSSPASGSSCRSG